MKQIKMGHALLIFITALLPMFGQVQNESLRTKIEQIADRANGSVGIVTVPNGNHFVIVVFISNSTATESMCEMVIAELLDSKIVNPFRRGGLKSTRMRRVVGGFAALRKVLRNG